MRKLNKNTELNLFVAGLIAGIGFMQFVNGNIAWAIMDIVICLLNLSVYFLIKEYEK